MMVVGRAGVVLGMLLATAAGAAPLARSDVPEPLRPWIDWALGGHEDARCPALASPDARECAWPSRLTLALDEHGGKFSQQWVVYRGADVPLPGDEAHWPLDVRSGDRPAPVVAKDGVPVVHLEPGTVTLTGTFEWDALPEVLPVPPATGLVALAIDGRPVPFPSRDTGGRLWLRARTGEADAEARLDVVVVRLLRDGVPVTVTTRLVLQVSGKSREALLARALPSGFAPLALESPLPARLEPDGRLRVQLRPGAWTLAITGRDEGRAGTIALASPEGPWAAEEVWAFQADPALRQASIEGVEAIDPGQTMLPAEWRAFPAYRVRPGDTVKLVESRRGDAGAAPDELALDRTWWLDFDGGGYAVHDRVSGTMTAEWRLEMAPPMTLGRASVGGADQPITRRTDGGAAGVELRERRVALEADARLDGGGGRVPAVGWTHDFARVSAVLNLPPGWRLFDARGVDVAEPTWLSRWTLLDLFVVLVTAMATLRLFGLGWGALALATLGLTYLEPGAPQWAWLAVLAAEALVRALPVGRSRRVVGAVRLLLLVLLVTIAVPYALFEARLALHPSLEFSPPVPPASAPASKAERDEMMAKRQAPERLRSLGYLAEGGAASTAPLQRYKIDPSMRVQTGPGKPGWTWNSVALRWQGPVERAQTMRLLLVPPWANRLLGAIRVALMAILFVRLLGDVRGLVRPATALVLASLLLPALAQAGDFPSDALLEQLRDRLLEPPACAPSCVGIGRLALDASESVLRLRLEVDAAADGAVALPGSAQDWTPTTVVVDGAPAAALMRTSDGRLWLAVGAGRHDVLLEGALPARDAVSIPLPARPRRATATLHGWTLAGLHEDGLVDENLQLSRTETDRRGARDLEPGALPPFVRVVRRIALGLTWEADTRVERLSPTGAAIVLDVPLLPGEAPTSGAVRAAGGTVAVSLQPQADAVAWHSVLAQGDGLELAAPEKVAWVETWVLDAGPMWHVEAAGVPTVQPGPADARVREWRPWPGERATIAVSRPGGVAGPTLTIDESELHVRPGIRATDATLALTVRSSQGGRHRIGLPPGAALQSVQVNGVVQPIRQDGDGVTLPVTPGTQRFELAWRQSPDGIRARFAAPAVDLGTPSVNATTVVTVPQSRWILAVGGPRLGPAVLFWSTLVVIALVAVGLGRSGATPLGAIAWFLLGIGLSQVHVATALVVVGWFLLLAWRRRDRESAPWLFDLRQVLLVPWTLAVLAILFAAIQQGLLGTPDMQIAGNGSWAGELRWYVDRSAPVLPQPWVVSVPLMTYRLAMLAWSVWIAAALVGRWLVWSWESFSAGGLWRPLRRRTLPA